MLMSIRDAFVKSSKGQSLVIEAKTAKADRVRTLKELAHDVLVGRPAWQNRTHRCNLFPVYWNEYQDVKGHLVRIAVKGGEEYDRLVSLFKFACTGYNARQDALNACYDILAMSKVAA